MRLLAELVDRWRNDRMAKLRLGKHVVAACSTLLLVWAAVLALEHGAAGPTPLKVLTLVCGGPLRTAILLSICAVLALVFPFVRYPISSRTLTLMLVPQQFVLLTTAGAGLHAAAVGHYADGEPRPWAFILTDQMPIIILAALYTVTVVLVAVEAQRVNDALGP
jgi:hypothetical protein